MLNPPTAPSTMADERTPLINPNYSTSPLDGRITVPLEVRATQLLALGGGGNVDLATVELTHELASTLYALHIVDRKDRARGGARAAATRIASIARSRMNLRDHAVAVLDAALCGENGPDPEEIEESDDDFLQMLEGFYVRETGPQMTTVTALLAHHTTPGAVLAHPLVRASLIRAWSRPRPSSGAKGVRAILDKAVTPSRAHLLELVASSVFVALTLATALVPDIDVGSDTNDLPLTIVWIIWAWASLLSSIVDAAYRRRGPTSTSRLILLLPAQIAGVLHPIPFTQRLSVLLRTVAIPTTTLALVLPAAPAISLLFPSKLLPLATILAGILARGARAAALLIPLAALLWALFAYALNGDVWRAGVAMRPGGPIEVGVAPFETRVALFCTLIFSLALSAALSILRAMAPSNELHDGTWEAEYGPAIGHNARRALAAAVARYLPPCHDEAPPPVPIPIPFNLLLLPLDILAGFFRLCGPNAPFALRRARGWVALLIVAAPCAVMAPLTFLLPYW